MKRVLIVCVSVALSAYAFGLRASAREQPLSAVERVIVDSGIAQRGVLVAEKAVKSLDDNQELPQSLQQRKELSLQAASAKADPQEYARYIAPLLRDVLTEEDFEELSVILQRPVVLRWFAAVRDKQDALHQADLEWRRVVVGAYFECMASARLRNE